MSSYSLNAALEGPLFHVHCCVWSRFENREAVRQSTPWE